MKAKNLFFFYKKKRAQDTGQDTNEPGFGQRESCFNSRICACKPHFLLEAIQIKIEFSMGDGTD